MQNFRRLWAPPPDPRASTAGGSAPKPLASGGWGLRPQTPKTAPNCEFLAARLFTIHLRTTCESVQQKILQLRSCKALAV